MMIQTLPESFSIWGLNPFLSGVLSVTIFLAAIAAAIAIVIVLHLIGEISPSLAGATLLVGCIGPLWDIGAFEYESVQFVIGILVSIWSLIFALEIVVRKTSRHRRGVGLMDKGRPDKVQEE